MDLNKLRIFKCVADVGQINEASAILKMAASNISQNLSTMEKELGCKVFTRHYKGVRLTKEGDLLYETAAKILEEYSFGLSKIKKNHNSSQETLEIATSFGISSSDWFVSNPRTGDEIKIAACKAAGFKAGKPFKDAINA